MLEIPGELFLSRKSRIDIGLKFLRKKDLILTRKYGIPLLQSILKIQKSHGAVAQLGARLNGIQKVEGSNPFSSTFSSNFKKHTFQE
jgi:hypothetical protein